MYSLQVWLSHLLLWLCQIAAFIAEPVMGAGGVILPPKTYFEKVRLYLALIFFRNGSLNIARRVVYKEGNCRVR